MHKQLCRDLHLNYTCYRIVYLLSNINLSLPEGFAFCGYFVVVVIAILAVRSPPESEIISRFIFIASQSNQHLKGTCRDHRVTGALNFHKIRDVCILVMVLDV